MVPLPFSPDEVWGAKTDHRVAGQVESHRVRAVVEAFGDGHVIVLGPAWLRDCDVVVGKKVAVVLAPEGPQRDDLPEDLQLALQANPEAGIFFDGLAQFYRRAYLRWIDGTKGKPEVRAKRIAEVVDLLTAKVKQRPNAVPVP
jgi:Bacteriocin-protection, YdeI or OmpD-Associated